MIVCWRFFLLAFSLSCAYIPQNLLPYQIWDENGVTLTKAFEKVYESNFSIQNERCRFFETQINGGEIEYEINKCRLKHSLRKASSQVDRQKGVEIKGNLWIEGETFRTRSDDETWSKQKSFHSKFKHDKIGYEFKKRNGKFEFTPTIGAIRIHRNSFIVKESKLGESPQKKEGGILFVLALGLFFMLLIFWGVYRKKTVGLRGEKYTAKRIKAISNGIVFRDVYVNGSHGVQQIDIIAVTEKGVFVVEKKTFCGLVVGGTYDKLWRIYYYGGQMHLMKNPHHQNYGHIQALRERFPALSDFFIDLVIFGDNAVLGDDIPPMTIYDSDFEFVYTSFPTILNEEEIDSIACDIAAINNEKSLMKEIHKEKIRRLNGEW